MAKLTAASGEIEAADRLVARMADRMQRLGAKARRDHYAAKARARIEKGSTREADAAIVIAAGG